MRKWYEIAKRQAEVLGVGRPDLMGIFGVTTPGAVGHYLNGLRQPSIESLPKLADRLHLTLDQMLRGTAVQSQSHPARCTGAMIASAVRLARGAVQAKGMDDFDPETDAGDAELLALALETVMEEGLEGATDSDVLRFARKANKQGVSHGEARPDRPDGGIDRGAGEAEAGGTSQAPRRRRRKSAA